MDCDFCFGPEKGEKELSNTEIESLIDSTKAKNINKIIFTGGEPLLRKDIFDLIDYAKNKSLFTILHTNGLLLNNISINKLENNLNQINLPLDGYDKKTNDVLRVDGHFDKIFELLSLLKNSKIRTIISTVASSKNKESVIKIGGILPKYIYKWRIFQFKPEGKAKEVETEFEISDQDFNELCDKIKKNNYSFKTQCISKDDIEFENSYCLK